MSHRLFHANHLCTIRDGMVGPLYNVLGLHPQSLKSLDVFSMSIRDTVRFQLTPPDGLNVNFY